MGQAIKRDPLQLHVEYVQPNFAKVVIVVPKIFVSAVYQRASVAQKNEIHTRGFPKGATPLRYIEQNYKTSLLEHVKEFLFKYYVMNFLYKELLAKKILVAGHPRLNEVILDVDSDAEFHFELSLTSVVDLSRWKMFPFKAPKRKNYKDIDRQVDSFIKEEQNNLKKHQNNDAIAVGDWVCFDIALVNHEEKAPLHNYRENVWLKIGYEEADVPFQEIFLNKKKGENFYSDDKCFQEYFASIINTSYLFYIEVVDIVHNNYFSLDHFKHHFHLKTNKEIHQKLIEVFSYRNDLSLRRAMAEETLKLLITKTQIDVPNYLVLRQQKSVLDAVINNPDYQVYKTQPTFMDNIRQLALKQVKETLIIDQLMHQEDIKLAQTDFNGYLNLRIRPRTNEFIYFNLPSSKLDGQETPLSSSLISQCCLREKTLNFVIYNLTKK